MDLHFKEQNGDFYWNISLLIFLSNVNLNENIY